MKSMLRYMQNDGRASELRLEVIRSLHTRIWGLELHEDHVVTDNYAALILGGYDAATRRPFVFTVNIANWNEEAGFNGVRATAGELLALRQADPDTTFGIDFTKWTREAVNDANVHFMGAAVVQGVRKKNQKVMLNYPVPEGVSEAENLLTDGYLITASLVDGTALLAHSTGEHGNVRPISNRPLPGLYVNRDISDGQDPVIPWIPNRASSSFKDVATITHTVMTAGPETLVQLAQIDHRR